MVSFRLFVLLVTFDGLGSSMGHVFEILGCAVGGLLTLTSMLQGELKVGNGVH